MTALDRGAGTRRRRMIRRNPTEMSRRSPCPWTGNEAARRTWDILSSDDEKRPEPKTPTAVSPGAGAAGFDEVEFLEGAKLFFARFQQARDAGDFQAIRDFISDEIFNEAMAAGDQGRIEVMLLTARLMEFEIGRRADGVHRLLRCPAQKGRPGRTDRTCSSGVGVFPRRHDCWRVVGLGED